MVVRLGAFIWLPKRQNRQIIIILIKYYVQELEIELPRIQSWPCGTGNRYYSKPEGKLQCRISWYMYPIISPSHWIGSLQGQRNVWQGWPTFYKPNFMTLINYSSDFHCHTANLVPVHHVKFICPDSFQYPKPASAWPWSLVGEAMVIYSGGLGFNSHPDQRCPCMGPILCQRVTQRYISGYVAP